MGTLHWLIKSNEEELVDELFKRNVYRENVPCDQEKCNGYVHMEKANDGTWLCCNTYTYKFSIRLETKFLGK